MMKDNEDVSMDREYAEAMFEYLKTNPCYHPDWRVIFDVVISHPRDGAARRGMSAIAGRLGVQSSDKEILEWKSNADG